MGDVKGFLKFKRKTTEYRPVCERLKDYSEVLVVPKPEHSQEQASRCMDCGIPFCHWGCPIGNYIPDWNDAVFRGHWEKAFGLLDATNNLPEITGRICPAPCEYACVLGINDDPVTIREDEEAIIEYAFKRGLIKPQPPKKRTGKKVAVIGSGPSGLSCAHQLNKAGHLVTIFERDDKIGGILRYGIPDFKLEKWILDRRISMLEKEGITFKTSVSAGVDYPVSRLKREFDAICLACGSRESRDLVIEGRQLKGIHFAMDYLIQSNKRIAGDKFGKKELIDAKGKKVVVIGGGDTGADCVGTAHRQAASCVTQIEIMPMPAACRTKDFPWPKYPMLLKSSTSHEEGGKRDWSVLTKKFIGQNGELKKLSCVRVEFVKDAKGCPLMKEAAGSGFEIEADLAILALGFLHPQKEGPIKELKLELDARGNVKTDENFMTSVKGIFSAGDMRRGQSLIVWAISEGRRAAFQIDKYLMGDSTLPIL
ncbi:glutamate synthase subunit beta [bacterium]|nr:MAG: glutamate synthase subunit beta [bacterium]